MDEDAGIHDDLIITKTNEGFLIILNAACKDSDFKILKELKFQLVILQIIFYMKSKYMKILSLRIFWKILTKIYYLH